MLGSSRVVDPGDFPACAHSPIYRVERGLIGVNGISGNKPRVRGQLPNSGLPSASLAVLKPSDRKGDSVLGEFLICTNRNCRFLVSLREGNKLLRRSDLIFSACPDCNHEWSGRCPFCVRTLDVAWRSQIPCCAHCSNPLEPESHVDEDATIGKRTQAFDAKEMAVAPGSSTAAVRRPATCGSTRSPSAIPTWSSLMMTINPNVLTRRFQRSYSEYPE